MTPEQEQSLLDQTAARIRALTDAAYADLIQRIRNGEAPRDAIAAVTAGFAGEYYAELSVAFSAMLTKTIGVAEIKAWPLGEVALSERLYRHTAEVNAATDRIIREHAKGFTQARELAMQLYEGYEFKVDPLAVKARLPKYLRAAMRDPSVSHGLDQIFARARAAELKTPALRAAYLQAIDEVERGAGMERLRNVIKTAWYERNRYFANRIAQTELHRVYEDQKAVEVMDDDDLEWVQVRMSATHPRVDICDFHARLDRYGQGPGVYPKDVAPKPPFHPFCLSGDTLITASGRIAAVSKRWFDGYVVVITTATGKHITATINHPILTRGGWIAAGLLNLGDEVVCRVAADGVGSDVIINDQHQDVPTSIAEIADAFFGSSQVTPTEVPVSAEDFHGDGVAGQVAVIGTDSKLGDWVDAGFPEHAQHHDFSGACPTHGRLLGNGICNFGGEASSRASKSGMGISGQGGSLGIAESRHSDSAGIAAASNADSAPIEVVNDSGSADADPFGYREAGFAAGIRGNNSSANLGGDDASFLAADGERVGPAAEFEPALNKSSFYGFSADSILASKIIKGETGAIVFEAIVNIKFSFWSGHVYNLDTEYGHYTSNGIITHNCRCRIVPRYDIDADIPQRERNGADRIFMRSLSQYDQRLVAGSRERLQRFHDGETIESIHDQATRKEYRLKRFRDGESIESIYDQATRKEYRLKRLGEIKPQPET